MSRRWLTWAVVLGFGGAVLSVAPLSPGAPPKRGAARVSKKLDKKPKVVEAEEETTDESSSEKTHNAPTESPRAGPGTPKVTDVKEQGDGGVKTYKFGAVEVEGRLKSPQIVYFLRRVRAEFAAGELGHRSFLRELTDTRRNPALK